LKVLNLDMFSNNVKLRNIDLSYNKLTFLDQSISKPLLSLEELYLRDNQLQVLNLDMFSNNVKLRNIDLSYNELTYLNQSISKPLLSLEELYLRDNQLQVLNLDMFSNNVKLRKIDLSYNKLTFLDQSISKPLLSLEELDLSNNKLEVLNLDMFSNNVKLRNIDLSNNKLTSLDQSISKPLLSLEKLDLSHNRLEVLNLDMFSSNVKLGNINLSNNKLSKLRAKLVNNVTSHIDLSSTHLKNISALRKLIGMNILDLSNNKYVIIELDDFSEMAQLKILTLSNVNLQHKLKNNYQFLKPLCQLEELNLRSNKLTSLNQFPFLPNLQTLFVDSNKISELDVNALKAQLPKLVNIHIEDNPHKCRVLMNVEGRLEQWNIECDESLR
jgi:Leucine-rich repeat (LRR) protein